MILQPGFRVFEPEALIPLTSALMFALYGLLTRYAGSAGQASTSFFWTGTVGAVVMTSSASGSGSRWRRPTGAGWRCFASPGAGGHWLLIKTYEVAEASAVQPFAYLQLVFATALGIAVFGERPEPAVFLGAAVIVSAGLFTLWRERRQKV
jgi:drug/metabolite transporter (DMT)-like permease